MLNSATTLLCSILETGCLEDKSVRDLLDEFKLISIEFCAKDGDLLDSARKNIDLMTNLFAVLSSMSLYYASILCSDSKGINFINALRVWSFKCYQLSSRYLCLWTNMVEYKWSRQSVKEMVSKYLFLNFFIANRLDCQSKIYIEFCFWFINTYHACKYN